MLTGFTWIMTGARATGSSVHSNKLLHFMKDTEFLNRLGID